MAVFFMPQASLQNLGGCESLEMVDDDLLQAHKADSPVDNLDGLK
jgi:hypothetical protein